MAILGYLYLLLQLNKRRHQYPPGPRPLPIIGNLHQLPRRDPWRTLKTWHNRHGPIITVWVGSRPIIIIGSFHCAKDLFKRRGAIYGSRPAYFADAMGSDSLVVALPYGLQWRRHCLLLHTLLNKRRCKDCISLQDLECKQLLWELLWTDDFAGRIHRFAASLTFALAYGRRLERGDEPEVKEIDRIMRELLGEVCLPGVAFPILDHLPDWLAPWRRSAARLQDSQARALQTTQTKAWSRTIRDLACARWPESAFSENEMAHVVGVNYEAGSDTTAFVLERPAVLRAQAELDEVVGSQRMPTLDDMPRLPYLQAFVEEVLRWRPVVPGGYRIPRGTTVIQDHWSLDFDEEVFQDPHSFLPERLCPGENLARKSLNLYVGNEPPDPFAMTQGISSRPQPFKAEFRPRSPSRRTLIETEWKNVLYAGSI
ncbi:cytochrome P450 [Aspergillus brunneoviolaceus CBS 621.78]|uniref:Cytochrome P450 n=1 Tax=Aspergillus brunneoviolaceus CBS 621.78 TaxID=1450534 RepID=A0ACD1FYW3_9EURO|nr:cytochrome P450 [Aspergillus brunneoviolaceus CBS 621.78]RAH42160.1 cytochrome P450 [Aspergillus brunneoviolaceus CBS 621.78]